MKYGIGDIIKFINTDRTEYHIITDYEDFSDNLDMTDVWYQVVQIYPVAHAISVQHTSDKHFKGVAKYGTNDAKLVLDFIDKERARTNIHGEPSYINMVEHNLNSYEKKAQRLSQVDESVIEQRIMVDFDEIKDINEGLDLMNHFSFLARVLEDDTYLEAVEMVKERLSQLT